MMMIFIVLNNRRGGRQALGIWEVDLLAKVEYEKQLNFGLPLPASNIILSKPISCCKLLTSS